MVGNFIIALLKLWGAIDSNSSGLLAEAAHSFADSGNQFILLIGTRLALRPASVSHPFGYGKDRYFWTFLAAVAMFTVGATFSVFQGVSSLTDPGEVLHSNFNYVILAVAAVLEIVALTLALRVTWSELRKKGIWSAIRDTKDPTRYIIVFEDTAALVGIGLAALGLFLAQVYDSAVFDGIAAILIGILLGVIALVLGYESRSLLLGEAVDPESRKQILRSVNGHKQVKQIIELQTMHIGPDSVLVGMELDLDDTLSVDEVERLVRDIESSIREFMPSAIHIFVETVSPP